MFNSLKYAKKLEEAGVSREQAEAHVYILSEVIEHDMATKMDVEKVSQNVFRVEEKLQQEMHGMENRIIIRLGALTAVLVTLATGALAAFIKFSINR